ncbi:DUF6894 family protein [Neorhizobium petrolearium]|uniref:DUF6894 family protein n=1 Tax=Neorhizobium petrolearium TaxID=515361 RepID=UPI003F15DB49
MPRFYFHLNQLHDHIIDLEGTDFDDVDEAKVDALAVIRELAGERLRTGRELELLSIRICDEEGDLVTETFVDEALRQFFPLQTLGRLFQTAKR